MEVQLSCKARYLENTITFMLKTDLRIVKDKSWVIQDKKGVLWKRMYAIGNMCLFVLVGEDRSDIYMIDKFSRLKWYATVKHNRIYAGADIMDRSLRAVLNRFFTCNGIKLTYVKLKCGDKDKYNRLFVSIDEAVNRNTICLLKIKHSQNPVKVSIAHRGVYSIVGMDNGEKLETKGLTLRQIVNRNRGGKWVGMEYNPPESEKGGKVIYNPLDNTYKVSK